MNEVEEVILNPAERMKILVASAKAHQVVATVPLPRYYRSLSEMFRLANIYMSEHNLEKAFVLYIRFVSMLLEEVPKHKDYHSYVSDERTRVEALIKEAMKQAEKAKNILKRARLEAEEEASALAAMFPATGSDLIAGFDAHIQDPGVSTAQISFDNLDPTGVKGEKPQFAVPSIPERRGAPAVPPRDSKPSTGSSHSTVVTGATDEMRDKSVIVAKDLVTKFLDIVNANTERNVETCGVLCGQMLRSMFVVSHVVLPRQTGASDGCTAQGEEEVFAFQDRENMITLGWIHTHPTQTAFLSSVDLHTQQAYQLMMPDAIAIVCAPKHNEVGVFTMTLAGMDVVGACTETSGFHPHAGTEGTPLFRNADHVHFSDTLHATIVDLRNK